VNFPSPLAARSSNPFVTRTQWSTHGKTRSRNFLPLESHASTIENIVKHQKIWNTVNTNWKKICQKKSNQFFQIFFCTATTEHHTNWNQRSGQQQKKKKKSHQCSMSHLILLECQCILAANWNCPVDCSKWAQTDNEPTVKMASLKIQSSFF